MALWWIVVSSQIRDLGVIFDRVLSLRQHVTIPKNKEVHTTGHKCCPYQVIGNVETGLFKWFVVWTP